MLGSCVAFSALAFWVAFIFSNLIGSRGVWFISFTTLAISISLISESLFFLINTNFFYSYTFTFYPYFSVFDFSWSIKMDYLSIFIVFLILFVSFFIQCFSGAYIAFDVSFSRFIIYITFFAFSMLLLVTGSNLLVLFVGWELVGLASVLLINFWFNRQEASWGAFKAFSFNRVGDAFIILAIALFASMFGSLNIDFLVAIFVSNPSDETLRLGFLFLIFGSFAKSAQFFLHSWLPDAMEGPTPVSALLHSATMVTAGVYLTLRVFEVILLVPFFQILICVLGVFTSFYSSFVSTTVSNAKHTTAYTTLNQLGFMFYAVGSLCFSTALFHLFVHGFYKSFTFLENAIELSVFDDEQDGALSILSTTKFESFYDIFGFLVFLSVNALPLSSPSVSKEVLIFSGFETISNFFSFVLLTTLFIGLMDSCSDDPWFEQTGSVLIHDSSVFMYSVFPMFTAYFFLGFSAFTVVFFAEEVFLNLSFFLGDFYRINLSGEGSLFLFFPFFSIVSISIYSPLTTFYVSSNFQFKSFISNFFYYDTLLVTLGAGYFKKFSFFVFKNFDRGILELFSARLLMLISTLSVWINQYKLNFFSSFAHSFIVVFFLAFFV